MLSDSAQVLAACAGSACFHCAQSPYCCIRIHTKTCVYIAHSTALFPREKCHAFMRVCVYVCVGRYSMRNALVCFSCIVCADSGHECIPWENVTPSTYCVVRTCTNGTLFIPEIPIVFGSVRLCANVAHISYSEIFGMQSVVDTAVHRIQSSPFEIFWPFVVGNWILKFHIKY